MPRDTSLNAVDIMTAVAKYLETSINHCAKTLQVFFLIFILQK